MTWERTTSRSADRERRRVIEACLAAHDLRGTPRVAGPMIDEVPWGERFGAAAVELGPGFGLFARYLSTRPDLFAIEDVLALERLEVEPLHVDTRARWEDRDGIVRAIRPGLEDALADDLPDLVHLRPAFTALRPECFDDLLAAFRVALEARLDPRIEARGLRRFAEDLADPDLVVVPEIYAAPATSKISARQPLVGRPLGDLVDESAAHRREAARRLHLVWLQQALVVGHVPFDAEWLELEDGRLALVGGRFEPVAEASRPRLWEYLRHVAGHRPEDAYDAIAGELRPVTRSADPRELRLRLRQLVPFRDGGWTERRDTLAELLVLHWRLVGEQGFEASPALETFWAGLYQSAAQTRALGEEGDALRAAFEDLRWLQSFRGLRELGDPRRLGEALEANAASLLDVPRKLDQLLEIATGETGTGLRLRVAESPEAERRKSTFVASVCLALLMASVVLFAERAPALGVPAAWVEPATAAVFLALGALLLRTIFR